MRKFLFIFAAILAYLLLSSKSCGSDEKDDAAKKEAELTQTKVNIRNEFESDDLTKKSLKAFEVKAEQKLVDFSDYLDIYSDKTLDESFKKQAQQMILGLFISDSVLISNLLLNELNKENIPIKEFLSTDSAAVYNSIDLTFDSIKLAESFHRVDELNYKGRLSFQRYLKICSIADTLITGPAAMEADIMVSKVDKPFGSDTLQIWNVFFGDMK